LSAWGRCGASAAGVASFSCAVGLAGFIYLLFTKGFGIPLPKGLLGEWLF
jgi:hypothetical protein